MMLSVRLRFVWPDLVKEKVLSVRAIMVAAPHHPLCTISGPIPRSVLDEHIQLVLTDRTDLSSRREFGVFSSRTWRLADLGAKLSFLRAGLGFGSMPRETIEADLASGALVQLRLEDWKADEYIMPLSIIYPAAKPPGMAGRWLMERLKSSDYAA